MQRPARFFTDFHPDTDQSAAAAALLEVCHLAAAEVYTHPRVLAALLATTMQLLPSVQQRQQLAAGIDAAAEQQQQQQQTDERPSLGRGMLTAVAALAVAASALDDVIYSLSPAQQQQQQQRQQQVEAERRHREAGHLPQQQVQLLLACRHALRSAAAAHSQQECADAGADGGGAAHPYKDLGSSASGNSRIEQCENAATARTTASSSGSSGSPSTAQSAVEAAVAAYSRLIADPKLSPLLLLTTDQANVIRPLLKDAGLDAAAWMKPAFAVASRTAPRSSLVGPDARPIISSSSSSGSLNLRCSRQLRVAPGPGGLVELPGLVSATEAAQEWLITHHTANRHRQPKSTTCITTPPARGLLQVPLGAPLSALIITPDVLSLLMQQHPNQDVRRQLHLSGLLPRRRMLLTVLTRLTAQRTALARERGAPSYSHLLLAEGSPLREPAAVDVLLRQLAAGVAAYAESDLADLSVMAVRRARVGEGGGAPSPASSSMAPWDADYYMQAAAVVSSWSG